MTQERSAAVQSAFRLLSGWAEAFVCLAETLRPEIVRLAEALNGIKAGPAVRGYEPFLIENGTPSFEARLMAVSIVRCGDGLKLEDDARRGVSRAFRRTANAAGKGTLVISRRARELSMALNRPVCIDVTAEAFRDANCSERFHDLSKILDQAIQRDPAACDALMDLANVLVAHLPDPRGVRFPSRLRATKLCCAICPDRANHSLTVGMIWPGKQPPGISWTRPQWPHVKRLGIRRSTRVPPIDV